MLPVNFPLVLSSSIQNFCLLGGTSWCTGRNLAIQVENNMTGVADDEANCFGPHEYIGKNLWSIEIPFALFATVSYIASAN